MTWIRWRLLNSKAGIAAVPYTWVPLVKHLILPFVVRQQLDKKSFHWQQCFGYLCHQQHSCLFPSVSGNRNKADISTTPVSQQYYDLLVGWLPISCPGYLKSFKAKEVCVANFSLEQCSVVMEHSLGLKHCFTWRLFPFICEHWWERRFIHITPKVLNVLSANLRVDSKSG